EQVQCKSCAKILATISSAGLIPSPPDAEAKGCDMCQQFRPLYDAMVAADEEYASFSGRRDTYGPKQNALANFRRTHMEFNNWLMCVEATGEEPGESLSEPPQDAETGSITQSEEPRGTKRAHSPTIGKESRMTSPNSRLSTGSLPERKHLKFSEAVEFRDEYRPSNQYSRTDEAYQKGRHAPPEGSMYIDTSGSGKTFLKFLGMKKVGKAWVDVWKDDDDEDENEQEPLATKG
ncbi:hypothetical protein EK21DRAFT_42375, partial [Setomelanomma holmii]